MRVPLEVEKQIERQKIAAYVVGHLPIIKSYAVKIGLVDIINELIPSKMDVDPGTIFLGMVMDTLSGRTPLYRLDEFFKDQDTELLLGKRVNPVENKRVKLVSLWSGILESDSRGKVNYEIDIPQFSGDLRVMAVAYKDRSFGSADANMKVADPVVISASLPRFLSPNDTIIMPVTLSNTTEKEASANVKISADGPISIVGNGQETATLKANSENRIEFKVLAKNDIGNGKVNVTVNALSETFENETELAVRPAASLQKTSDHFWLVLKAHP